MKGSVAKPLIACRFDLAGNEHETGERTKAGQRHDNGKSRFKNDEAQLKLPTPRHRLLS